MPNLRGKTWTTTTPANVGDAQYWEDHLISDADAAKISSSVQTVNGTGPDAQGNVDIVALPDGGTLGQVLTKQSSADGDADWEDPASSGHTIEDEDGNTMPYQSTLQFENAEVTNDSVNNKTIVDCKGSKGDAATITVGTVTTLPAGSDATVTNSGTSSDAVFDFGIPKGADGAGAVDSVNGKTGVVTLGVGDLDDVSISSLASQQTIVYDGTEWGNEALADVALSGSYNDLSDQPTIPTVDQTYSATSGNAQSGTAVAEVVEQIYADNGVVGAKNLLPNTSLSGTYNGITFTKNSDGSITANGTATALSWRTIGSIKLPVGKYILNGCPAGGDTGPSTYCIALWNTDGGTAGSVINVRDGGDGVAVDITQELTYSVNIGIAKGQTVNNLTFYPMLRLASDPDDTYVPYAMTNRELMEKVDKTPILSYTNGNTINSNTDLNNLKTAGMYYCQRSAIASSLQNCPVSVAFGMQVIEAADNLIIQEITYINFHTSSSVTIPSKYQRCYERGQNTWTSWYKFTGTVVS